MRLEKNEIKDNFLNEIKQEWLVTKPSFPTFLTVISKATKVQNEQYIQTVSDNFKKQFHGFSQNVIGRKKRKQKVFTLLADVLHTETIIGIQDSMDPSTSDAFQEEIKEFLRHVRQFSPELSIEGMLQALRNYIVYAMFNVLNQMTPKFNIASFGYSMLYPFTDNYIDSKQYSVKDKLDYNQLIRDKIEGNNVHPTSIHQRKTCELLQAIESNYPREKGSTVYMLLLMILEAQEDSIRQQKNDILLSTEEILDISLYKGSISVVIDRFFVNKDISKQDLCFYLSFGFFLQLCDDLQDIKEDSVQGHQTLFTAALHCEQEEKLVNKLLHFLHQIMDSYQAENDIFKNFVLLNCYQLVYSSVVTSKEFFSKEYLDTLEQYLPITFPFLEKIKADQLENRDLKIQDHYLQILDQLIF